jgi:hypothetical protein
MFRVFHREQHLYCTLFLHTLENVYLIHLPNTGQFDSIQFTPPPHQKKGRGEEEKSLKSANELRLSVFQFIHVEIIVSLLNNVTIQRRITTYILAGKKPERNLAFTDPFLYYCHFEQNIKKKHTRKKMYTSIHQRSPDRAVSI